MKKAKKLADKPRIGRPPVGPLLNLRVSPAEKEAWLRSAAKAEKTLSEWLRNAANEAAKKMS